LAHLGSTEVAFAPVTAEGDGLLGVTDCTMIILEIEASFGSVGIDSVVPLVESNGLGVEHLGCVGVP
jgi:hypothetical protein